MLRRSLALLLALVAVGGLADSAQAQNDCALTDIEFLDSLSTLRQWPAIHDFYRKHLSTCPDDGMYAEGYTDVVVHTLATDWSQLGQLALAVSSDSSFKRFVLRHIDASADEEELRSVLKSANSQCPRAHAVLCAQIAKAARTAINELR